MPRDGECLRTRDGILVRGRNDRIEAYMTRECDKSITRRDLLRLGFQKTRIIHRARNYDGITYWQYRK